MRHLILMTPAGVWKVTLTGCLMRTIDPGSRFYGKLRPYVTRADPQLVNALQEASSELGTSTKLGLTISNSGFFAPQGRDVARVRPSIPDLDKLLGEFDPQLGGQLVENMEMESAFLIHFMNSLGYHAAAHLHDHRQPYRRHL